MSKFYHGKGWDSWKTAKDGQFEQNERSDDLIGVKDRTIRTQRGSDLLLKRREMTRNCMGKKKGLEIMLSL